MNKTTDAFPVDWTVKRRRNIVNARDGSDDGGDGTYPAVNGWVVSASQYTNHRNRTETEAELIEIVGQTFAALCATGLEHDNSLRIIKVNLRNLVAVARDK